MNRCPHCKSPAREDYPVEFRCGSVRRGGLIIYRSMQCAENEITQLQGRIAKLTAAGQDAIDFVEGIHREYARVVEGWRKATG